MLGPMMPTMGAMMRAASDVDSMFEHVMRDVGEGNFNFVRDGRAMRAMRGAIGRAKVEETKRGFLISAHAPGLAAKDVHVHVTTDARGNAKLCVSAGERSMTELGLPTKYIDMSVTPKASCIDGILRIAVLKKTSEAVRVPINATARAAIAEGEEDMETDDDGDESTITLSVPGFGERDITVTLHKPEDMLVVRGDSKTFGTFAKTFKNLPTDLEVKHIDVTVRHGLLNIKMADPHAIIPMDIIVSSVNSVVEEDSTKENVTLVRRSVPGVSADKVTCRLAADRMLHINIATSHGRAVFQQSLPRNIDFHSIRASCADGVLTVSADRASGSLGRSPRGAHRTSHRDKSNCGITGIGRTTTSRGRARI
jgi:HSP20 family molecular chaperone IbpA